MENEENVNLRSQLSTLHSSLSTLLKPLHSYYSIMQSVPAAIRMPPITPLTVTVSCRTTNARIIVITTLSLSIGTTFDASPICSAR